MDSLPCDRICTGTVINRENIGKTSEKLVALWNETYPDDLVSPATN